MTDPAPPPPPPASSTNQQPSLAAPEGGGEEALRDAPAGRGSRSARPPRPAPPRPSGPARAGIPAPGASLGSLPEGQRGSPGLRAVERLRREAPAARRAWGLLGGAGFPLPPGPGPPARPPARTHRGGGGGRGGGGSARRGRARRKRRPCRASGADGQARSGSCRTKLRDLFGAGRFHFRRRRKGRRPRRPNGLADPAPLRPGTRLPRGSVGACSGRGNGDPRPRKANHVRQSPFQGEEAPHPVTPGGGLAFVNRAPLILRCRGGLSRGRFTSAGLMDLPQSSGRKPSTGLLPIQVGLFRLAATTRRHCSWAQDKGSQAKSRDGGPAGDPKNY